MQGWLSVHFVFIVINDLIESSSQGLSVSDHSRGQQVAVCVQLMEFREISAKDRVSGSIASSPSAHSGVSSNHDAILSSNSGHGSSVELIRTPSLDLLQIHRFQTVFEPHGVRMVEIVQGSSFHFVNYTLTLCQSKFSDLSQ